MPRCLCLVILAWIGVSHAIRLAVVSKIIIDTMVESGVQRLGGGGVQAAVGASLSTNGEATISLHAPVGRDFVSTMLHNSLATRHGVDVSPVTCLESVATTPGEIIQYDGERMKFTPVGWDGWQELCAWVPPLEGGPYDAVHVIVEGAGTGEVDAILQTCSVHENAAELPFIGIEPVMHEVNVQSVNGLCRLSRLASLVCPDLRTAICVRRASMDRSSQFPAAIDEAALTAARDPVELLQLAAACFDELCMQPGAYLAIRDGAKGSYVYTRPAPGAPMRVWLACTPGNRQSEWFEAIPAVALPEVADPTGAGNAYAGAFSAQLASGASALDASAVATAVGAAFCRTSEWCPPKVNETRHWVMERAGELRAGAQTQTLSSYDVQL